MRGLSVAMVVKVLIGILALAIIGCAGGRNPHSEFIPTNIDLLTPGLSVQQFEEIFGAPDLQFETEFGQNTDQPWKGLVYKYFISKDPAYLVERWRTNTFVFYVGSEPPELNHWTIEQAMEAK